MVNCPVCKELITPNGMVYKASAGFLNLDGEFHEDSTVIVHRECCYNYVYNPFEELEEGLKNS
jgi:hypothetical protein